MTPKTLVLTSLGILAISLVSAAPASAMLWIFWQIMRKQLGGTTNPPVLQLVVYLKCYDNIIATHKRIQTHQLIHAQIPKNTGALIQDQ